MKKYLLLVIALFLSVGKITTKPVSEDVHRALKQKNATQLEGKEEKKFVLQMLALIKVVSAAVTLEGMRERLFEQKEKQYVNNLCMLFGTVTFLMASSIEKKI